VPNPFLLDQLAQGDDVVLPIDEAQDAAELRQDIPTTA
jgi:hypothetical protein